MMSKKFYIAPQFDTWRFPDIMDTPKTDPTSGGGGSSENPLFGTPARRLYV